MKRFHPFVELRLWLCSWSKSLFITRPAANTANTHVSEWSQRKQQSGGENWKIRTNKCKVNEPQAKLKHRTGVFTIMTSRGVETPLTLYYDRVVRKAPLGGAGNEWSPGWDVLIVYEFQAAEREGESSY